MKWAGLALIVLFLILYIVPLGIRPLAIPDETRYAEIPREMLTTGDWIAPKLDGLRYFEKPVLGYWLNAVSIFLFGENAFAIRLPSALSVGFSALLIFFVVRKFSDDRVSALLAATAYLTCFEVFGVGTFCVLDSVFSTFLTVTVVCLFLACQESASLFRKNVFLAIAGISCGLAFLTKGFLAFVLPVAVLCPFLIWQRQWKALLRIWWVPLAAATLVALPWSIAVHIKEPDFWRYFFWHEHIQRFLNADEGQHTRPFWYLIPIILGGALPWTTWLPNAIVGLKNIRFKEPFVRFLICWFVFPFLFFSMSSGKLETYILPCFPPLVILIIIGFRRWYELPGKEKIFTRNQYISAVIMILIAAAFALSQFDMFGSVKFYQSQETWKWLLMLASLLFYGGALVLVGRQKETNKRLIYCCLAPLALMFFVPLLIPDQFKSRKMPGDFLRQNINRIYPDTVLASDNYLTPAVCWFYKRSDVYLFESTGEFEYGLNHENGSSRLIDRFVFETFIQEYANGGKMVLITTEKRYADYREKLPKPLYEVYGDGFVLAEYEP